MDTDSIDRRGFVLEMTVTRMDGVDENHFRALRWIVEGEMPDPEKAEHLGSIVHQAMVFEMGTLFGDVCYRIQSFAFDEVNPAEIEPCDVLTFDEGGYKLTRYWGDMPEGEMDCED